MARNKYLLYKKSLISIIKNLNKKNKFIRNSEYYIEDHLHEDIILKIFNRISKINSELAKELKKMKIC